MGTQYNVVTLAYRNFIVVQVNGCCINELYLTG